MKEVREVMNTIRAYCRRRRPHHLRHGVRRRHGGQPARHGGRHRPRARRSGAQQFRPRIEMVAQKTGTDNAPIVETINYGELEVPAVMRSGRRMPPWKRWRPAGWTSWTFPPSCASRRTDGGGLGAQRTGADGRLCAMVNFASLS
jgi:hypothetical protein